MCGHCIKHPPAFDKVICPFIYSDGVTSLISTYKRSAHAKGCEYLINTLIMAATDYDFDSVVPVPYHWKRLLQRGHNPVRELAIHISHAHSITINDILIRQQSSSNQKQLNRQQRLSNLHGAFTINQKANKTPLTNQNILLIDDVLTTGATCHSAALTLKQAGAKSVTVACLARTPAHN
jgi:ComF family protein